jgi:hypothetical protein
MSRRAHRAAGAAAALTLAALAGAAVPPAAQPPLRKDFGERLAVRETELVFGPDDELLPSDPPGAFAVVEDGAQRPVTRAERLKDEPWRIVVYVDPLLASPASGHLAVLALARASEALAERGTVELVVADPAPKLALAATREPRALENRFADLAGELTRRRDRGAGAPTPEVGVVRRQLDRLVAFLAVRPRPAPHALILVADGRDLSAATLGALGRERVDPARLPEDAGARDYAQAAQTLAAYGWVTLPMALRAPTGDEPEVRSGGVVSTGDHGGIAFNLGEIWRRLRGRHPRRRADPRLAEYGADSRLAVLRAMARMTGGGVVASPAALSSALADLPWRWHLWYSAPSSVAGRALPVAIELLRTGKELRGQQWVRSGVPEGLTDARLSALLAASGSGQAADATGDLAVELRVERTRDGTTVRARLAPAALDGAEGTGPWRVSIATGDGLLRREALKSPQDMVEVTPPAETRRVAAVIEEVGGERWGGAVAELSLAHPAG